MLTMVSIQLTCQIIAHVIHQLQPQLQTPDTVLNQVMVIHLSIHHPVLIHYLPKLSTSPFSEHLVYSQMSVVA